MGEPKLEAARAAVRPHEIVEFLAACRTRAATGVSSHLSCLSCGLDRFAHVSTSSTGCFRSLGPAHRLPATFSTGRGRGRVRVTGRAALVAAYQPDLSRWAGSGPTAGRSRGLASAREDISRCGSRTVGTHQDLSPADASPLLIGDCGLRLSLGGWKISSRERARQSPDATRRD